MLYRARVVSIIQTYCPSTNVWTNYEQNFLTLMQDLQNFGKLFDWTTEYLYDYHRISFMK